MKEDIKNLIKKQEEEFIKKFINVKDFTISELRGFIDKVKKETAEYEKDRIKEKVEDWRRGFSMTCAESDIYEKAHQQILKVLKDI